jgi:hypothetical protein
LDARKHKERPTTFYEIVAEDFNDEDVVFYTECLPELHHVFAHEIELKFSKMPGGSITAEDVKIRFSSCRANLIHVRENVLGLFDVCTLSMSNLLQPW